MLIKRSFFPLLRVLFLFFLISSAMGASLEPKNRGHVYIFAGIGTLNASEEVNRVTEISIPGNFDIMLPSNIETYATSFDSMVGGGYTHHFKYFWLGLQGNLRFYNINKSTPLVFSEVISTINSTRVVQIKSKVAYSLLLTPGISLGNSTQLYGLLGPSLAQFKIFTSATFTVSSFIDALLSQTIRRYKTGYTLGLGISHVFHRCLFLSLEYLFTNYGNIPPPPVQSSELDSIADSSFTDRTSRVHLFTNETLLSLGYSFF